MDNKIPLRLSYHVVDEITHTNLVQHREVISDLIRRAEDGVMDKYHAEDYQYNTKLLAAIDIVLEHFQPK